jgi:acetyltransferase-like isoleucine patch superfamily enzyme
MIHFNARQFLSNVNVFLNGLIFRARKFLLGFENANAFLRSLDKRSMIPILRRHGAKIGERCDIEAPLLFHNCKNGRFDNLVVGDDCHIGKNCFFDLCEQVILENNVVVSMQSTFITHINVGNSELKKIYPTASGKIVVRRHAYLGVNVTVLKGVEIGDHALVAAGSVVNGNVEPHSVAGGVPACFIKKIASVVFHADVDLFKMFLARSTFARI